MKTNLSRLFMMVLWLSTLCLSIYITVNRPNIPESEIGYFFVALSVLAILSAVSSYVHLTILSPLSDVRSRVREGIDEEIEEEIEE